MARFKNFTIWRGRLPHWRADEVRYYVTFRHRRPLDEPERGALYAELMKQEGKKWGVELLCVLPEKSEMIVRVHESGAGQAYELSDIVSKAQGKAGKTILKKSGERFSPFYGESFDRIIRDESEFDSLWWSISQSPVSAELCDDPDDYQFLWADGRP